MRTHQSFVNSLRVNLLVTLLSSVLCLGSGCQCCTFTEHYADGIDHVANCPWTMEWAYCRRLDLTRIDCRGCRQRGHRIADCPQCHRDVLVQSSETAEPKSPAILQVTGAQPAKLRQDDRKQTIQQAAAEVVVEQAE